MLSASVLEDMVIFGIKGHSNAREGFQDHEDKKLQRYECTIKGLWSLIDLDDVPLI